MNFFRFLINIFKKNNIFNKKKKTSDARAGFICPRCGNCSMEYDGLLNLRCKVCGYLGAGSYT